MTLAPRVVLVHRRTELDELLARHGTRGQAAFFLSNRGKSIEDVEARHAVNQAAIATVSSRIPADWRTGDVERGDLARFLFAPDDIVVVVGQDGLVANVAKYLVGQPVLGFNPDPARNPGILVPHQPEAAAGLFAAVARSKANVEARTMVEAIVDDGQRLLALNEIYVGHPSHQTARYTLTTTDGKRERQASSGLIAATGTGATGWCRSAWLERHSTITLPDAAEPRLAWFIREAWPSPATGTTLTEGICEMTHPLAVTVESDRLVAFGDGVEDDHLDLTLGQEIRLRPAEQRLNLVT